MKQPLAEPKARDTRALSNPVLDWGEIGLFMKASANLLIALIVITIVCGTAFFAYESLLIARERATTNSKNLVQVLERQISEKFSKLDVSLQSSAMEIHNQIRRHGAIDPTEIAVFIQRQMAVVPEVSYYHATDAQGNVRYGPGTHGDKITNVSDREYFQLLRDHPPAKGSVLIGPVIGKLSHTWTIGVARRLQNSKGQFAGILYAAMPVEAIQKELTLLDLGEHGAATMRMANFSLVARSSRSPISGESGIGSVKVSPDLILAIQANPKSGTYIAATAIDNIERVNAYMRVDGFDAYILVGIATQDYVAVWLRDIVPEIVFSLLAIAATVLVAVMNAKSLTRQAHAVERLRRSEESFKNFFEQNSLVILLLDTDTGAVIDANTAAAKYYGHSRAMLRSMNIRDINTMPVEKIDSALEATRKKIRHAWSFKHRLAAGEIRDIEAYVTPLDFYDKRVHFAAIIDVTDRKTAEEKMLASEERYARVVQGADEGFWEYKLATDRFTYSHRYLSLLGYEENQLAQELDKIKLKCHPDELTDSLQAFTELLRGEAQVFDQEFRIETKRGEWLWINSRGKITVWNEDGSPNLASGTITDISKRKELDEKLRLMATTDFLTGVGSRRSFMDELDRELARIHRNPSGLCVVMMFDIDHFKVVNDTYGHAVGDRVLQHLTGLMRNAIRKGDSIGRVGGEEFGILMPNTSTQAAAIFAERLRQIVAETPLQNGSVTVTATVSIGVTALRNEDHSGAQALERADRALYRAKSSGRNRVEVNVSLEQDAV